jgi:hypothetical protein
MASSAATLTTPSSSVVPSNTYGVVTLDGTQYIERFQIFVMENTLTAPNQVMTNQRLTMPGIANFLLKGMTRDITIPNAIGSQNRRFRFRILNQEGSTSFFSGGLGMYDDRVFDNIAFGSGQFPYQIIPPIPVSSNGTLIYEIEDAGLQDVAGVPNSFPYTIHFGFIGTYLIPVNQAPYMQSYIYQITPGGSYGTLFS